MIYRFPGDVKTRLYLGAEAELIQMAVDGEVVLKRRLRKSYRRSELDEALNRRRTLREARLLHECKLAGVRTPALFAVGLHEHLLITEFVGGVTLRTLLKQKPLKECERAMELLGELVGRLHKMDITHGDLTTSNVIVEPTGTLALLDIGLGEKTKEGEKKAVDLVVLLRVLESDHHDYAQQLWQAFLRGYQTTYPDGEAIVRRAKRIKTMGRYFEFRGKS